MCSEKIDMSIYQNWGGIMEVSRNNLLTYGSSLLYKDLREICDGLKRGGLCILPSDTGYSIAAYPFYQKSIPRIEKVLPHVANQAIPLSFDSQKMISKYVNLTQRDLRLMDKHCPGPLTLVCKMKEGLPKDKYNALFHTNNTIGVRIPDSPVERQICTELDTPLTTCAIRYDDNKIIQNFDDAVDIVNAALKSENEHFIVYGVKVPQIKYDDHSTVATVQGKFPYVLHVYRPGIIEPKVLKNDADDRNLSYCDVDDWT